MAGHGEAFEKGGCGEVVEVLVVSACQMEGTRDSQCSVGESVLQS